MLQRSVCVIKSHKEKSTILVFAIGMVIAVAILSTAVMMLATSQIFLMETQKKELKCYYAAEAQIRWAASRLQKDPSNYDTIPVYTIEDAEEVVLKIISLQDSLNTVDLQAMIEANESSATDRFEIKAYVQYQGVFGKKASAVRLDAVVERKVERQGLSQTFDITTSIKEWQEIRPPEPPE